MTKLCTWEVRLFDAWDPPTNGENSWSVAISRFLRRLIVAQLYRILPDHSHMSASQFLQPRGTSCATTVVSTPGTAKSGGWNHWRIQGEGAIGQLPSV